MRKFFEIGGLVAAVVLIAFGVVTIAMGVNGRSTVASSLKTEQITGTPDMTPAGITAEAQKAKLDLSKITIPTCSVANEAVNTGAKARCFAQYMQIHALEATGGFVYAQMGQFQAKPGTPKAELTPDGATSNKEFAVSRSEDAAARRERRPQRVGDRDGADDGSEHLVHGIAARALRDRRRVRASAQRVRLRDPRDRRSTAESRDGVDLVLPQAGGDDRGSPGLVSDPQPLQREGRASGLLVVAGRASGAPGPVRTRPVSDTRAKQ